MSAEQKKYIAIIEVSADKTYFPEEIIGDTENANAIITLKGHYKDGKAWKVQAPRKDLGTIRYENVDEETEPEERKKPKSM